MKGLIKFSTLPLLPIVNLPLLLTRSLSLLGKGEERVAG